MSDKESKKQVGDVGAPLGRPLPTPLGRPDVENGLPEAAPTTTATAPLMKAVKKYLNDQVPVLFDFDGFPVNRKQNMLIHREFVKVALAKLIEGLEGSFNNAG